MSWLDEFWHEQRPFTLAISGEVFRVFLILLGLLAVFKWLQYMEIQGFDPAAIKSLDRVEVVIATAAITRGGWNFLGMLSAKPKNKAKRINAVSRT